MFGVLGAVHGGHLAREAGKGHAVAGFVEHVTGPHRDHAPGHPVVEGDRRAPRRRPCRSRRPPHPRRALSPTPAATGSSTIRVRTDTRCVHGATPAGPEDGCGRPGAVVEARAAPNRRGQAGPSMFSV